MANHHSLADSGCLDALQARLAQIKPTTTRQWGKMTPHAMLCHPSDSFLAVSGERSASTAETWFSRTVVKYIALHTSMPWPKGVPTRPEVDQEQGGTTPGDFARDHETVAELLRRFATSDLSTARHPVFGAMTRAEWLVWGYRHVDHHLRQFGL